MLDSGVERQELGSHRPFVAMAIIGSASLFACSFPSLSKRIKYLRIPPIIFFIGKHFGTGVILSTAFVHLLQDAFEALLDPKVKEANVLSDWVGLIVLASLLAIFLVEYTSTAFVDHLQSHQQNCPPTPKPDDDERTPLLRAPSRTGPQTVPATVQHGGESYFSGHHHRHESPHKHEHHRAPTLRKSSSIIYGPEEFGQGRITGVGHVHRHGDHMPGGHSHSHGIVDEHSAERTEDEESATTVDCEASEGEHEDVGKRRQVVSILVLQMGIMIHSLVIGLTLSITSGPEFASLLVAVAFHQLFEGLSLGIRIASLPGPPRNGTSPLKVVLVTLFAITVPVGISVGLLTLRRTNQDGAHDPHLQFVQGIMSAISAGMLVYAACVEMLAGDFVMDPLLWRSGFKRQALAIVSLLAGVAGMSIIGIWD